MTLPGVGYGAHTKHAPSRLRYYTSYSAATTETMLLPPACVKADSRPPTMQTATTRTGTGRLVEAALIASDAIMFAVMLTMLQLVTPLVDGEVDTALEQAIAVVRRIPNTFKDPASIRPYLITLY
jgi:hypothetical protein